MSNVQFSMLKGQHLTALPFGGGGRRPGGDNAKSNTHPYQGDANSCSYLCGIILRQIKQPVQPVQKEKASRATFRREAIPKTNC